MARKPRNRRISKITTAPPERARLELALKLGAVAICGVLPVVLMAALKPASNRIVGFFIVLSLGLLAALWKTITAVLHEDPYFNPRKFWLIFVALGTLASLAWFMIGSISIGGFAGLTAVIFVVLLVVPVVLTLTERRSRRRMGRIERD